MPDSDYCDPLTDQELLDAKIVYPFSQSKTEDDISAAILNEQKQLKTNDPLTKLAKNKESKELTQLNESTHRTQKLIQKLSSATPMGKTLNSISFGFKTGKVSNAI